MADIAAVFHWPASEMERMSLGALMRWRAEAVERFALIARLGAR